MAQPDVAPIRTFSYQASMPSLPVPALAETLDRYLESVRTLASQAELAKTTALVQDFANSDVGPRLQALLEERAKQAHAKNTSWLADWWLQYAYNIWRCPVEVNSNYAFGFNDPLDPSHPSQVGRAASLVYALCEFKYLIDSYVVSAESSPACTRLPFLSSPPQPLG